MPNFKEEFRRIWEETVIGAFYLGEQISLGIGEVGRIVQELWANDWIHLTLVWFTVLLLIMTK